ncbi:histidine phosphatase superfamily [Gymnopilus junonius]|uniref:Histidine phosphatase superfamily n=1 Tax=Gymnopilus junonius TaxID=109634 RepID=A0A9P5NMG8_GYMJU|nr:histidine phosphatase superfamily [Gymnopilus junonius]
MADQDSKILGVVLLVRHGDRQGFYQDPTSYTASNTAITPLGNSQLFELGQDLRSIYFDSSSPSFISTVNSTLVQDAQVHIRADGGGEGGVIFDSAVSLLQGLWPPTLNYSTTLANGTVVVGPMGGYQTVPIESVEPDNDVSLEGWDDCNTFVNANNAFYESSLFNQTAAVHANFLNSLSPYLDGRPVTLKNMWNIYDYMNVNSIHNATFAKSLPAGYLEQARDLANFHEGGVFSSPELNGIGNIGGQTILPSILTSLSSISNTSNPLKFVVSAISYKPFISLFNMTSVSEMNPQLFGIVNYAAAVAFEVRQPNGGSDAVIRFKFKNGTNDNFNTYNFMNSTTDFPVQTILTALKPYAVNDLPTWCKVCNNQQDRGCADLSVSAPSVSLVHHDRVSPVGAGFIGACVTLALMTGIFALLFFLGFLSFNRKRASMTVILNDSDSERNDMAEKGRQ